MACGQTRYRKIPRALVTFDSATLETPPGRLMERLALLEYVAREWVNPFEGDKGLTTSM